MAIEVFPVVHVNSADQAVEQTAVAFEAGADGVYLIDHHSHTPNFLTEVYNAVATQHSDGFIGLNFLQHGSAASSLTFLLACQVAGDIVRLPDGLWQDDANARATQADTLRAEHPALRGIQYLGGVAFKYTALYRSDPNEAAQEAARLKGHVDVVTTSGAGTGKAPSPEKIAAMKRVIGEQKLAVASGISAENIVQYGGTFDQLLVSTSVEIEPYSGIFVPEKLKELIDLAHA